MNVFVTGGNGYCASEFIRQKLTTYELSCSVRKQLGETNGITQYNLDLESPDGWSEVLEDCDVLVHMAAVAHSKSIDIKKMHSVNVHGTEMLAKACLQSKVKRFVFISTIGVHGQSTVGPVNEQSSICPYDPYTASKYEAELKLQEILEGSCVELVILRPALVYGAKASGSFGLLQKVVLKLGLTPFGSAKNKKQFLGISNFISIVDKCINVPNIDGEVFMCADIKALTLKRIVANIAAANYRRVLQLPIPIKVIKLLLTLIGKKTLYKQLFTSFEVDISKAQKVLSWSPSIQMEHELMRDEV